MESVYPYSSSIIEFLLLMVCPCFLLYFFQECEYEISQKGELVAKLEAKTKEISTMLTNLNNVSSKCDNC